MVANYDSVEDGAKIVQCALDTWKRLDIVVNNAGILRDKMIVNLADEDWDAVMAVHLRSTFLTTRAAGRRWRERSKSGHENDGRIINTSSVSGLFGNVGQSNYGAAKAGIAAFTIIAAMELGRYGVTVNALSPSARTRMITPRGQERMTASAEATGFDADPAATTSGALTVPTVISGAAPGAPESL